MTGGGGRGGLHRRLGDDLEWHRPARRRRRRDLHRVWHRKRGDGGHFRGRWTLEGDQALTANLGASWDPGSGVPLQYDHTDYQISSLIGYFNAVLGEEGASDISGTLAVSGQTTYQVSGSLSDQGSCAAERDQGEITLTGDPLGDVRFTRAASGCDGCVDWDDHESSGMICPKLGRPPGAPDEPPRGQMFSV